jgi:glycosyltransferase involved in cell wall biosynthesis
VVCYATGVYANMWYKIRGQLGGFISKTVERLQLAHRFDKVLFPSENSRKIGISLGIPAGITDVDSPGIEHEKFGPKEKEWYVLFMGRFAMQKGVYDLLEAAKLLPDVKFKLVGWGEEEEKMKRIATPNVELYNYNFKSGQPFFDMYAHAAVYCQPSLAESFGLTVVEAMASGCAIVSTVDLEQKGIPIQPNDPQGIADAITEMLKDKDKTLKMGKENIDIAKKYTWKNFVDKLVATYGEVLG